MLHPIKLNFPDGYAEQRLVEHLADHYPIKRGQIKTEAITIYDTFDWRVFNESLVLYESNKRLALRKLYGDKVICTVKISSPPIFIGDLPGSTLKEYLEPIVKMRALIKLAEVQSRKVPFRIVSQDGKTVARLICEEIRPSRGEETPVLASYLWVRPVKGYQVYAEDLGKRLAETGFVAAVKEDFYFDALEASDKKPGDYSTKLQLQLDPDMRSDAAAIIILRSLLEVMRVNETNLEVDLDTEFLHDFRVAVRRTRSSLRQVKNVFPEEKTARFKKDFSFVGKLSNQLRDLDVYLLKEDSYKAMLPAKLREDIDPLFDYLREKRKGAFQEVIRSLKTREYEEIMQRFDLFLREPQQDLQAASNADLPIIELARKRIYRKYRRVVKDGTSILENTQDDLLHQLRIQCKELRYLLEFFFSLFPPQKMSELIGQLKKLQDNLGDFNDFSVQEEYLLNVAEELPATDQKSKKTLVAIGSLIGSLEMKKQAVKGKFAKTFSNFASPPNKKLFRELFATKEKDVVTHQPKTAT
jgi:CHAD domain-containing protein